MMKDRVHVAQFASPYVIMVCIRDLASRQITYSSPSADVSLKRLQSAVRQLRTPAATGMVEQIDVRQFRALIGRLKRFMDSANQRFIRRGHLQGNMPRPTLIDSLTK